MSLLCVWVALVLFTGFCVNGEDGKFSVVLSSRGSSIWYYILQCSSLFCTDSSLYVERAFS